MNVIFGLLQMMDGLYIQYTVEQEVLEREITRLRNLYQQQQQHKQHHQQQQQKNHGRNRSKQRQDLDASIAKFSLKNKGRIDSVI